jgi:hypothetical protein
MSSFHFRTLCALVLPAVLAGCVTTGASTSTGQQIEVHTILDHREVAGVGCVLSNSAGRWFVVAPGRITVVRTRDPLSVDCARADAGSARELVAPRADSRFDTDKLIGNLVVSSPFDHYFDRQSGVGVTYPSTLTVLMRPAPASAGRPGAADNAVF